MKDDLKNILSNLNNDVEQEKLLEYLNKQLEAPQQHAIEQQMADDPFLNDAMEGLEALTPGDLPAMVKELNTGLHRQIEKSKHRRKRKNLVENWVYFSIVIIILLVVLGFLIIKMVLKQ